MESTCAWVDGCRLPPCGFGLCKRHYQYARRNGVLEQFRAAIRNSRVCAHCGSRVGEARRAQAIYCSKRCYNAAYKVNGAARPTLEQQRQYSRDSKRRKREALLSNLGTRICLECGDELPSTARLSRLYCSRACINQVSLRTKAAERMETARLRRARIRAAGSPGVSQRDWQRLVARFDGRCAYCDSVGRLTVDHVVPIARGGWHAIGNVLPACAKCNSSKRDDLLVAWRTGRTSTRRTATP